MSESSLPTTTGEKLAAEALESLRSTPVDSPDPSSSLLTNLSSHPLVSGAVKVYNTSKHYSPTFKYSAEKLEAVIIPRVNSHSTLRSELSSEPDTPGSPTMSVSSSIDTPHGVLRPRKRASESPEPGDPESSAPSPPNLPAKRTASGSNKWRRVLVTATSLASLSSESRQRLRYCLRFLKLATDHLRSKVSMLQELVEEESARAMAQHIAANHVPQDRLPPGRYTIVGLKQEIITTVRKVVTVLSNFAGNSLPEPARTHVRNYILRLPAKWALSLGGTQVGTPRTPRTPRTPAMFSFAPTTGTATNRDSLDTPTSGDVMLQSSMTTVDATPPAHHNGLPSTPPPSYVARPHNDVEVGSRVLSLARESLVMLEQIISIVDETLEKAESWCEMLGRKPKPDRQFEDGTKVGDNPMDDEDDDPEESAP